MIEMNVRLQLKKHSTCRQKAQNEYTCFMGPPKPFNSAYTQQECSKITMMQRKTHLWSGQKPQDDPMRNPDPEWLPSQVTRMKKDLKSIGLNDKENGQKWWCRWTEHTGLDQCAELKKLTGVL
jgi:hypothetical protein